MRDVLDSSCPGGRPGSIVGMGTVVETWKSAPRQPGAAMLVGPDGTAVGSVSGGCVEGAVFDLAAGVREVRSRCCSATASATTTRSPSVLPAAASSTSSSSRSARPRSPSSTRSRDDIAAAGRWRSRRSSPAWTALGRPPRDPAGFRVGHARARRGSTPQSATTRAGLLEQGRTGVLHYGADGERRGDDISVFVSSYAPRPRMIVFGAIDFAAAVARVGSFLGYRVTVCDARPVFATARRFPDADEVVVEWPHRYLANTRASTGARSSACSPTTPSSTCRCWRSRCGCRVAYVGAMGSRRTHEDRLDTAAGARTDRDRTGPAARPDRPRSRRAHARGDRGLDCG